MKPIIGIIVCGSKENKQFVSESYINAIIRSGGIPVILPCPIFRIEYLSASQISGLFNAYYKCCKGFLFCGGGDISPALFDQPPLGTSGETDLKMDLFQISFMEYLLTRDKPVLGICRGMQVMNVALGGTLYQDLSLRKEPTFAHMQNSASRTDFSHRVTFKEKSKLYNIFGTYTYTNSFHHQAIHKPGTQVIACGHADDGIIEAIEIEDYPFAIGVQWHPECIYDVSPATQKLFRIFVK